MLQTGLGSGGGGGYMWPRLPTPLPAPVLQAPKKDPRPLETGHLWILTPAKVIGEPGRGRGNALSLVLTPGSPGAFPCCYVVSVL